MRLRFRSLQKSEPHILRIPFRHAPIKPQLLCKISYRSDDFGIKFLEGAKSPLIHQFKHNGNNLGTNLRRGLPLCAQFLDDSAE